MTRHNGAGLARGPAALVGGVLLAFGLAALINHNAFPPVTSAVPHGHPSGSDFLGFEVNGWTAWFSAVTGSVVLFGSSQHLIAKFVSLVGGLALAGGALLGAVNDNIIGLAATNTLTDIGLGVAAAILLLNIFVPRVGGGYTSGVATVTIPVPAGDQATVTTGHGIATTVTAPPSRVADRAAARVEPVPR
jgi:hypothetical protein